MFRLRSKSGEESIFRSPEEIRSALLSGIVTPDAQIWDVVLKGWVPLLEHALYQEIAGTSGGRKSGVIKSGASKPVTGSTPTPAKPVPKLVIKRPGEGATPPPPPVRAPTPPAPAPVEEFHDLELIDIDMSVEPEEMAPAEELEAPVVPPPAPKRPSAPPPAPPRISVPAASDPTPEPRFSNPRISSARAPMAALDEMAEPSSSGSKKGLIIALVLVLAAAGGGYAVFGRKLGAAPTAPADTTAVVATPVDTTHAVSVVAVDTAHHDSTTTPATAAVDTSRPVAVVPTPAAEDTTPATGGNDPIPFSPTVARGNTPWNARPVVGLPLSIPALEVVRLRYLAAQARALQQLEAGLEAAGFNDMFDPGRVSTSDRRQESFDGVDGGRSALREFRRRQTAIDFVYTDSMRQALPGAPDDVDLRTFGQILRETPAQSALTDSLVSEVAGIYGMLVSNEGTYKFKSGMLTWQDADDAAQYQALEEGLTSQLARIRNKAPSDIPPAMAAILRGIGLPR